MMGAIYKITNKKTNEYFVEEFLDFGAIRLKNEVLSWYKYLANKGKIEEKDFPKIEIFGEGSNEYNRYIEEARRFRSLSYK